MSVDRPAKIKVLWFVWISIFLSLEFYAVGSPGVGDTLTEQIRPYLQYPVILGVGSLFWLWLGYHFLYYRPKTAMSYEHPLPEIALTTSDQDRLIAQTIELLQLQPVEAHKKPRSLSKWSARIDLVKAALSLAAHELIPLAEELIGATGPDKKAIVAGELLALAKALEKRVNLVPGLIEPGAWWLIRHAIDGIIELAFRQLEIRGIVNTNHV